MSEKDVTPKALAKYMEQRNQRFAAMSQTARRVKIDLNHTWRIRMLPVQVGPEKEPFVDIAQHWWNKQPITCPRHTTEAWGGDPEYPCPVCELSERLRESNSEEINNVGYRARCNLRVRSWCIVFDMEDHRGNVDDMPISEILNPYEFDMYKTTWESFSKYQKWALSGRRGGKEASEWGLLDLETGCDLLATQGAKGVTLDRCDPGPIFPLNDPKFDEYIQKIWNRVHKPKIVIPNEKDLLDMTAKIEEHAERGGSSRQRRGRDEENERGRGRFYRGGRSQNRDDDDSDDRDRTRGDSRRSRYAEDEDTDTDTPSSRTSRHGQSSEPEKEPQEEAPAPPTRRSSAPPPEAEEESPAPRRSSASGNRHEPEPQEETPAPPTRRSSTTQTRRSASEKAAESDESSDEAEAPAPAAPPPARRSSSPSAPPSARRSAPTSDDGAGETDGDLGPQRPPTRRAAALPPAGGVDDEEDNAPEEQRDPAPPVKERVEDAPPRVSASSPAPKRTVGDSSDIKARLERLNSKGK